MKNASHSTRARRFERLFASTPKQRRALLILALLLFAAIYRPGLEFAFTLPLRASEVGNSNIRATIPYSWKPFVDQRSIAAARPCLSIFCRLPDTSMEAQFVEEFKGRREDWIPRTESRLRIRGGNQIRWVHEAGGIRGMHCLKSLNSGTNEIVEIGCLNDQNGLVASYTGVSAGLGTQQGVPQSDLPGVQTVVVDHSGQVPDSSTTFSNVDAAAALSYLQIGEKAGRWLPLANDCNTWCSKVVNNSTPSDRQIFDGMTTFMGYKTKTVKNAVIHSDGSIRKVAGGR